jgi:hypothetical protein
MKESTLKWAKKYHKWPALIISFFLILIVISGMVMNHRNFFSKFDLKRKYLPGAYQLKGWNLASVRSAVKLNDGNRLIFGNIGIWETDSLYSQFTDFNSGFPKGMDMRKVRVVKQTQNGNLLAGTYFGLYRYSLSGKCWTKINLPSGKERIQDIVCLSDKIIVMTRSELLSFNDNSDPENPEIIRLKAPEGYDKKVTLFRFIWITHSGEIAGITGKLFLDFLGLLILFLISTGLIYFFVPKIVRKFKTRAKQLSDFRRVNLRYHNKSGAWFLIFLIAVPLTGMFLRPPFLITIANSKIPVLPLNSLGKINPWEDKLRSIVWSAELNKFILSTSDGFFVSDSAFAYAPQRFENEPPVSVMGINVFEYCGNGSYYIGSFDGLFRWNIISGEVIDLLHPGKLVTSSRSDGGRPSENLISGMIVEKDQTVLFDYDKGALSMEGAIFPAMPEAIISASPMALWNVAQEIHTGRIYQSVIGPFYILIVPMVGLLSILIFITGYIRWRNIFRKKPVRQQTNPETTSS